MQITDAGLKWFVGKYLIARSQKMPALHRHLLKTYLL